MSGNTLWKRRAHMAAFATGVPFGSLVLFPLQGVINVFSFEAIPEQQSMLQFGGFAVLVPCWIVGLLSQFVGITIARRRWAAPRALHSALAGTIYSASVFALAALVPTGPGTAGARILLIWILLFPGFVVVFWAWLNHPRSIK